MQKREGVWESRYLPINTRPPISHDDHQRAVCSRCGQEWRPGSKTQYSPCCYVARFSHGHPAEAKPPRNPLREPMAGDRLTRNGGRQWRAVEFVRNGIVAYLSPKGLCHCTIPSWGDWALGKSHCWSQVAARVERRGDA